MDDMTLLVDARRAGLSVSMACGCQNWARQKLHRDMFSPTRDGFCGYHTT